jgi:EAL domain-containing protein (putative c-di-GMP-specific phosphodiesterase class I)
VETEEMLEALRVLGADYAQGYLVGRPQTLEELLATPG